MFLTECPRDAMQGWGEMIPTQKKIDYINRIKEGEVLKFYGHVEKRYDKYQLIINKIDKIRNEEQNEK